MTIKQIILFSGILIIPSIFSANEANKGFGKPIAKVSGETKASVRSVSQVDGGNVFGCSLPFWFSHGLHGFKQRTVRYNEEEMARRTYSQVPLESKFNVFHPLQSVRVSSPMYYGPRQIVLPKIPFIGPLIAAYGTAFTWNSFKDLIQ